MKIEELSVPDAFVMTPQVFADRRGSFLEWFRHDELEPLLGFPFNLAQANWSTSVRGVIRGLHYADVPPGQAKYVVCVRGAVLDVVVDLRVGSPAFGAHAAVDLDDRSCRAVYLGEGLGHAFCALTDDTTVVYLCSTGHAPEREHGVHPLDPALGLPWPDDVEPVLSGKDAQAPALAAVLAAGGLPRHEACVAWSARRRAAARTTSGAAGVPGAAG